VSHFYVSSGTLDHTENRRCVIRRLQVSDMVVTQRIQFLNTIAIRVGGRRNSFVAVALGRLTFGMCCTRPKIAGLPPAEG